MPGVARPRRLGSLAFAFLACIDAGGAATAHAAAVSDRKLGWSACAWPAGHVITVGVSTTHPFPDPGFIERLDDAVSRWDQALAPSAQKLSMQRSDDNPDVVVQYQTPGDDDQAQGNEGVLGETYLLREGDRVPTADINECPDRQRPFFTLAGAYISIAPREDWFTGPDSSVDSWQNCTGGMLMQVLLSDQCEQRVDFGSTITHELGHALVLYHPQSLDEIDDVEPGNPDSATTAARCVEVSEEPEEQATMCAGQTQWRADQRTLTQWDLDTVTRQYLEAIGTDEPEDPPPGTEPNPSDEPAPRQDPVPPDGQSPNPGEPSPQPTEPAPA